MGVPFQAGFVGKVSGQADFVRVSPGAPLAQPLHRWLEEGNEALARGGLALPTGTTFFLLDAPEGLLAGALANGRDRVGRTFPSAVFVTTPQRPDLPLIPGALAPFLSGAVAVLDSTAELDGAGLMRCLAELSVPGDLDLARARDERRRLLDAPHDGRLKTLFEGRGAPGSHFYGLRTFLSACDAERRNEPGRAGLALDCPLSPTLELGPDFWLDLSARRLPRRPTVTALWTSDRLLLGFGAPAGAWLGFLAKPDHPSMKRWPLATSQSSAVEAARSSLSPSARGALERLELPTSELLAALAT